MKYVTLLAPMAALSGLAFAAPTVNFTGLVSEYTCQASINGEANGIVLLPTVSVADFDGAGSTAGSVDFTVTISGCTESAGASIPSILGISVNFLGHNVTAAGNLGNSAANGAGDVAVQLVSYAGTGVPMDFNKGVIPMWGMWSLSNDTSPKSFQMAARYVTEGGNPTAGGVTAVAEYSINYQ